MTADRPTVDYELGSVSVPRALMPSLLAAQVSPRQASPPELSSSGLLASGRLDPLVASLLQVMTEPDLVLSVESQAAGELELITFWRRHTRAVAGTTGPGRRFLISLVSAELLPFDLAQAVSLAPCAQPQYRGKFTVPRQVLASARRSAATSAEAAGETMVAAGVSAEWADRLVAAFLLQRSRWAIESVSLQSTRATSSLAVLDAGHAGFWRLHPIGGDEIEVTPVGFDRLLDLISALIP
ncbi:MAG: ESX secretion-associated protein EspG [Acidimicrobiia bacterium]|nr:ESX secretion-associated protein EspG [Acidimicrobiia bacterium]